VETNKPKVNVLGSGVMGSQIASLLYLMGYNVFIWNHKQIDKDFIYSRIRQTKRLLSSDFTLEGSISFVISIRDIENNITIETVKEDLTLKKTIYKETKNIITNPYFTNSSSIKPSEIGENVNGLHFFNPLSQIKVIEYILKSDMTEELELLFINLKEIGFDMVNVNDNVGYIANFILFNEISSVFKLIEVYKYKLEEIQEIYIKVFKKDILKIIDLVGLDTTYSILKNLKAEDESIYLPRLLDIAIEKNILGKKNNTTILTLLKNND
jgi:3-hydroxyacyl-CoA dehydrogenase